MIQVEEAVPLTKMEYWVLAQVGLEVVLVLILLLFLLKIRSMSKLLKTSRDDKHLASGEMARLVEQLAFMETKQAAMEETLSQIGERVLGPMGQSSPSRRGAFGSYTSASPESGGAPLRLQVEDLHLQGFSPTEIARRLGLHPTEVKMALDLARLKVE